MGLRLRDDGVCHRSVRGRPNSRPWSARPWALNRANNLTTPGVAPFAFAFIGDMPYGAARETPFARLMAEVNRDNDVDFVMHAGDIKAGSERCDDELILHRFRLYQAFERAFVYTPGDNEWTDCHRVNNGQYNPLERLVFLRSVFYPQVGQTTGGQSAPYGHRLTTAPTPSSSRT
jgi:hypothetical protein